MARGRGCCVTRRRRSTWNAIVIPWTLLLLLSVSTLPVSAYPLQPPVGEFQIQVGEYTVTIIPDDMPSDLYRYYPAAEGHPVVANFIERFHPIWVWVSTYYNNSVGAPTLVEAALITAMNQSGFFQLVCSTNGTGSEIDWTCTISGHNTPVNAFSILHTAVERLLARVPEGPIRLYNFHLAAEQYNGNSGKRHLWYAYFQILGNLCESPSSLLVKIDMNGTIITDIWKGGPPLICFPFWILFVAVGATCIIVIAAAYYIKGQSTEKLNKT